MSLNPKGVFFFDDITTHNCYPWHLVCRNGKYLGPPAVSAVKCIPSPPACSVKKRHLATNKIILIEDTPELPKNDSNNRAPFGAPPSASASSKTKPVAQKAPPKRKPTTSKISNTLSKPNTAKPKGPKKFAKPLPRIYTFEAQSPSADGNTGYAPLPFKAISKARYDYRKLWAASKARERQKRCYDKKREVKQEKTEGEKCLDDVLEYDSVVFKAIW